MADSLSGEPARQHVLFINWYDHLDPKAGGAEIFLWEIARRLRKRGLSVTILSRRPRGAPATELLEGCRFIRLGAGDLAATVLLPAYFQVALRRRADIVIEFANKLPFLLPLLRPKRLIVVQHHFNAEVWEKEFGLFGRFCRILERWVFQSFYRGQHWVVVSASTAAELASLRLRPLGVSVVENGADHVQAAGAWTKSTNPSALVFSRLRKYKSVDVVLKAWKGISSAFPAARLLIVGTGPEEESLRQLSYALGLEGVTFVGAVSPSARDRLLAESWVLLQPSLKEGWGLTVMEAARLATPSIAADVAGLRDSVDSGSTGLLVPHGDVAAWTRAVLALFADPSECRRLGANAAERSESYSWERSADGFTRAVHLLLDRAAGAVGPSPS